MSSLLLVWAKLTWSTLPSTVPSTIFSLLATALKLAPSATVSVPLMALTPPWPLKPAFRAAEAPSATVRLPTRAGLKLEPFSVIAPPVTSTLPVTVLSITASPPVTVRLPAAAL